MVRITDPVEVFDLLEIHGQADFDPTANHTAIFPCDKQFAVLVFCFSGIAKGPRLYLFDPPFLYTEMESAIVNDLSAISGDEVFEKARTLTLENLRNKIESLAASNFYFDAH